MLLICNVEMKETKIQKLSFLLIVKFIFKSNISIHTYCPFQYVTLLLCHLLVLCAFSNTINKCSAHLNVLLKLTILVTIKD